jgi:uncharacterized membrane protein YfcA
MARPLVWRHGGWSVVQADDHRHGRGPVQRPLRGTVIVPLLVFWLGYGEREAAGTSLAAIVFIAGFAAVAQGIYGNLHVLDGLLVGIPAMGGVLIGTWLQQRMATRSISLLFAAVLVLAAVELLLQ